MKWSRKHPSNSSVGLVFGSGGARGWAHIGVQKAFQELGFEPDLLVGTSIGSVAAAIQATGRREEAEHLAAELDWKKTAALFFEIGLPRSGLLEGRHFMDLLRELITESRIDRLAVPFAAVATDLHSQKEVVLSKGDLFDAIRASMSIPGVFTPVSHEDRWLVDGGLVNPLPVSVARGMGATTVVAVDINLLEGPEDDAKESGPLVSSHRSPVESIHAWVQKLETRLRDSHSEGEPEANGEKSLRGMLEGFLGLKESSRRNAAPALTEVVTRALRMGENAITRERLLREPPDLLIQPAVGHIGTLEFHRSAEAIRAGYEATMDKADALRALKR